MIKELVKMIEKKMEAENQFQEENDALTQFAQDTCDENLILNNRINLLQENVSKLQNQVNTLLDELSASQTRIDALLRQLKEKNGGK